MVLKREPELMDEALRIELPVDCSSRFVAIGF